MAFIFRACSGSRTYQWTCILLFDNILTRAVAQLPIPKTPLDILGAIFLPRVSSIFKFGEFYILQPSAPRYSA